ncbi:MAG: VOC family protein [Rhizobacter sp.]
MLNTSKLVGFVGTTKPAEAKRFYEQSLGLQLVEESPFALVFASGGTTVRVQKVQSLSTPPYTSLGWEVKDIAATVQHLSSRGVEFQRYDGLPQNEAGIWRTPDGSQVAWFRDPDGNTLSLTEHVAK